MTSHLLAPIMLSLYCQASLAVVKRYIPKLIKYIRFYKPIDSSDPISMLAIGSGYKPRTLLNTYAIDRTLPTRLQAELLELYSQLLRVWQEWNEIYYSKHSSQATTQATTAIELLL